MHSVMKGIVLANSTDELVDEIQKISNIEFEELVNNKIC